jgi:hypothetical protein
MRRVRSQFLQSVVRLSVLAVVVVAAGVLPAGASAEPIAVLGSFGNTPNGELGGQLLFARGVAVNQAGIGAPAGSVYVAEANPNHRISQFSSEGAFVRAWGYDVVRSGEHNTGANEQQSVTLAATVTGGTFTLGWPAPANTTAAIPFNATPGQVQAALEAVSTIGAGNVSVTSPNPGGGGSVGGPYTVTFQGALGGNDVAASTSVSSLTGSPNTITIATPVAGGGLEVCQAVSSPADVCKSGVAGGAAGQLGNPLGIAIDQSNGYLYVPSANNRRTDVFSGTGQFAGAFGWGVDTGAAAPEVCTTASTCQAAGAAGADAGRFATTPTFSSPAVDPSVPGRVYIPDPGNLRIAQYSTTISGGVLTAASFVKAFGWGVDTGAAALESCTIASTCQIGTSGNGSGQFTTKSPTSVAVDSTGAIYASSGLLGTAPADLCSAAAPCRVQKFAPDASSATNFGPTSSPGQLLFTSGVPSNTVAALSMAVDPANDHVFVLRKGQNDTPSNTTWQVLEYDSTGAYLETHPAGTAPVGSTQIGNGYGLALGTAGRVYVNQAAAATTGQVSILGPVPPPTVAISPASAIGSTTATFDGTVTIPAPGAPTFNTTYHFEYSKNGATWTSLPATDANVADGTTGSHPVSQTATGLDPNTLYSVRLVATIGSAVPSPPVTFTTDAVAPGVQLTFSDDVAQTEATLGAHINPNSLPTTYHFEWGTDTTYGNQVPAFERQLGSGSGAIIARDAISDLAPASEYHFRVVATNSVNTSYGPDQTLETLNSCGLPDGRCIEMVSPVDKGPIGTAGKALLFGNDVHLQAALEGGRFAYTVLNGLPDATVGEEVLYIADRDATGWHSKQVGAAAVASAQVTGTGNQYGATRGMAEDLSCGVVQSPGLLTADAPLPTIEAGGTNLFRRDYGSGDYTVMTNVPALNADTAFPFQNGVVVGMASDCNRVVFTSLYRYQGIAGAGSSRLYEWDHGTLRNLGVIPAPGGTEAVAEAVPGTEQNSVNSVSDDASRVVFTATSLVGGDLGKRAVFMREDSAATVDVSQSETPTANNDDARYEIASTDGSRVFFLARYGLADNGSSSQGVLTSCASDPAGGVAGNGAGCDLYEYDVDAAGDHLTDLTPHTSEPKGAGVVGVLAASDDGDRVYFAARGQLVAGKGRTLAQNESASSYNVYLTSKDGATRTTIFVGLVNASDRMALVRSDGWVSRATPDGRYLMFPSSANVTGYESGGAKMVYRYSADTGAVVCVSCRPDGEPSSNPTVGSFFPLEQLRSKITMTEDGSRVFFYSMDALASGAVEGRRNLYQWVHGQVFFVSAAPVGESGGFDGNDFFFAGASADGRDAYFVTSESLVAQDVDGRRDLYNVRIDGGFAAPPAPEAPCDPLSEGDCQGSGADESTPDPKTGSAADGNAAPGARIDLKVAGLSRKARLRASRQGRLALAVSTSEPGKLSLTVRARLGKRTSRVGRASKRVAEAGVVRFDVRLSFAARKRLRAGEALGLTVNVAQSGARSRTLTVRLPGAGS